MFSSLNLNYKLIFSLLIIVLSNIIYLSAQQGSGNYSITGKVYDNEGKGLRSASVQAILLRDSSIRDGAITDREGNFTIDNLRRGEHRIEVSFIGFKKFEKVVNLTTEKTNLGTLKLTPSDVKLGEITVEGQMVRQEQKEDTTIYNAGAFKVNPDASTEDLLKKMPGVVVEKDGTVKAQGEDVKRVLVDGKEFFGEDPTLAIRSLPAEVIDKIQVFDRASDQAQFTGFDDGNAQKTLNIITKSNKNTGNFGKLYAGYGTEDRYWAGGNVNYFNGDLKLSVIGLSNNINQQNFAMSDVMSATGASASRRMGGSGPRGPGGPGGGGGGSFRGMGSASDFMVGQQNGISTTNSIGMNYSDTWIDGMTFTGSYFFNNSSNDNSNTASRNFFTQDESTQFYVEDNNSISDNMNHRFNGRLEYKIDSSNSLIFRPRINLQSNEYSSIVDGGTTINSVKLNQTNNDYNSDINAYTIDNSILYNFKFPTTGRTLSIDLASNINKNSGNTFLFSNNMIFDSESINEIELNQDGDLIGDGYKLDADIEYTEPITENSMIKFDYEPAYTVSNSDKEIYNLQPGEENIRFLDTLLTNNYENIYTQHKTGLSYMYRTQETNINFGVEYQTANLEGKQIFPTQEETKFSFSDFLPNFRIQHNFTKTSSLRINYRTSTNAPSVSQLQNVVDNSNPILLKTGNPDLKQNFTHTLMSRIGTSNFHSSSFLFAFGMLRFTNDYIANSQITAKRDTVIRNIPLFAGSQLSQPVNIDGYVMGRAFAAYGRPVSFLKSNFNFNLGFTYTRTPSLINEQKNLSNNYSANSGIVLSSNISPSLDFTLSYNANYAIVENSLLPEQDNNYFIHVANASINWILWEKLVLNTEVFHNLYKGLEQDFDQEFLLWNASIGYKFLDNNAGEIRLSVYDILGQNISISRNVTELYLEDLRTQVLQRYFMLTFTYNLRSFGG